MSYHYLESGLDNVYLTDGYTIEHHPAYGEMISIENVRGLHDALGMMVAELPRPLNGAEFRFLRHELDLSQKTLATLLGVGEQSVAQWEKARTKKVKNEAAERLLRVLYMEHMNQESELGRLVRRIADLDSKIGEMRFTLHKVGKDWKKAA